MVILWGVNNASGLSKCIIYPSKVAFCSVFALKFVTCISNFFTNQHCQLWKIWLQFLNLQVLSLLWVILQLPGYKIKYFCEFWKITSFLTLTFHMTLKNEVKVKFDHGFGGFGYMFGVVYYSMLLAKMNISGRKMMYTLLGPNPRNQNGRHWLTVKDISI